MPTEVELDVFSGRPNPTWRLDPSVEAEVFNRLRELPSTARQAPRPPALGYRGILIHSAPENGPRRTLRLYKGVVEHADGRREDRRRELETRLLRTGAAFLDANLMQMVAREIAQS